MRDIIVLVSILLPHPVAPTMFESICLKLGLVDRGGAIFFGEVPLGKFEIASGTSGMSVKCIC